MILLSAWFRLFHSNFMTISPYLGIVNTIDAINFVCKKAFIYSTYFAGLFLVFSPEAFFQYDIWRCFDPENQSEGAKY